MKQFAVLCFFLLSVAVQAQQLNPTRVYPVGSQIAIGELGGPITYYPASVVTVTFGTTNVRIQYQSSGGYLNPGDFLNSSGSPYGATMAAAQSGWNAASLTNATVYMVGGSSGGSSGTSVTPLSDNLTTTTTGTALDARQGSVIKSLIDANTTAIGQRLLTTTFTSFTGTQQGVDNAQNTNITNNSNAIVATNTGLSSVTANTSGTNRGDQSPNFDVVTGKLWLTNAAGTSTSVTIPASGTGTGTIYVGPSIEGTGSQSSPLSVSATANQIMAKDYNGPFNRPFVTNRNFTERNPNAANSNGTDLLQTFKVKRTLVQTCTDIQLVYTNQANNPISLTVTVQTSDGTYYPVYFSARRNPTVDANGFLLSDPISINLVKGDFIWVLTTVGVATSGQVWYKPQLVNDAGGGAATAGADYSNGGGTYAQNAVVYAPVAVIGRTNQRVPVIAGIGDSIMFGQGANQEEGYIQAFGPYGVNYSVIQMGLPGSPISNFTGNIWKKKQLLASCTAAITEGGYNDIFQNNQSLASVQASMIACWRALAHSGIRVFQTTITPRTSSTDGWATTTNQSIADAAKESIRTGVNDWIRDGAPVNASLVAVAVGTSAAGTLRMGQTGHPLINYFDTADKLETARNSGIWKASPTLTSDGTHPNVTGNTLVVTAIDVPQTLVLGMAN